MEIESHCPKIGVRLKAPLSEERVLICARIVRWTTLLSCGKVYDSKARCLCAWSASAKATVNLTLSKPGSGVEKIVTVDC
ncbi:MAG: hypothetical protein WC997_01865 [Porticoccaceae bacterium]